MNNEKIETAWINTKNIPNFKWNASSKVIWSYGSVESIRISILNRLVIRVFWAIKEGDEKAYTLITLDILVLINKLGISKKFYHDGYGRPTCRARAQREQPSPSFHDGNIFISSYYLLKSVSQKGSYRRKR